MFMGKERWMDVWMDGHKVKTLDGGVVQVIPVRLWVTVSYHRQTDKEESSHVIQRGSGRKEGRKCRRGKKEKHDACS